jgi:hypothetical protein
MPQEHAYLVFFEDSRFHKDKYLVELEGKQNVLVLL